MPSVPHLAVSDVLTGLGPRIVLAAAVLGALATIGAFIVKAVRKIPRLAATIVKLSEAAHAIVGDEHEPGMAERLKSVEAELHPNGGGSLRDVVNRLERGVGEAKAAAAEAVAHRNAIEEELREGRGTTLVLLNALSEYADDAHQKEIAYVRALQKLGVDLTDITTHLDPG